MRIRAPIFPPYFSLCMLGCLRQEETGPDEPEFKETIILSDAGPLLVEPEP